jgi:hypothetical protein
MFLYPMWGKTITRNIYQNTYYGEHGYFLVQSNPIKKRAYNREYVRSILKKKEFKVRIYYMYKKPYYRSERWLFQYELTYLELTNNTSIEFIDPPIYIQ